MDNFKLAFYVPLKKINSTLQGVDINVGNPGIGGSEYLFLITVHNLNLKYGRNTALVLTDHEIELADEYIPYRIVKDIYDGEKFCLERKIDNFVIRGNIVDTLIEDFFYKDISIYLWAHNTLSWKQQCLAAKYDSIKSVVAVSKTQFLNMSDTPCASKCTYINNGICEAFYKNAKLSDYEKKQVVYVGSLVPQKGIHNLIEIWKYVEREKPEAELIVFGGATTWNVNAVIDKRTSADQYYNKVLERRLKKLNNPSKVRFMGSKGWNEIGNLISSARVGVVNPSYYMRDETFCMSAVELQSYGLPVVSRQRGDGLNSTVIDGFTGFLEKDNKKIAQRIVELLNDKEKCAEIGLNARNEMANYLIENQVSGWIELVDNKKDFELKSRNTFFKSRDARLLDHDFMLKMLYLVESGKLSDLIKRKLKY